MFVPLLREQTDAAMSPNRNTFLKEPVHLLQMTQEISLFAVCVEQKRHRGRLYFCSIALKAGKVESLRAIAFRRRANELKRD